MARLVLSLLALCATGALASSNEVEKVDIAVLAERQGLVLDLFQHIYEPAVSTIIQSDAKKFDGIDLNLSKYNNQTAAETYHAMIKLKWILPRSVPFSVNEPAHAFEAMTLFNVLYSAKDFETFIRTASYLRDIINEGVFVYTVSIAVIYRKDTQNIALPPIYETFPSLFNKGEVMATAHRISTHGHRNVEYYPSTYVSGENVVIKENATAYPYFGSNPLYYFTNDYGLNAAQYFLSLVTPYWLGGTLEPAVIYKERRGEAWWFAHRQLVARYYMERLSNGLGEIPDITNVVAEGFNSGLVYSNGVPLPSRPDNFRLDQPQLADALEKAEEFERRIWEAVDKGYYINRKGEHVSLLNEGGLDVLGRLIESNADSPNRYYYKDFIRLIKQILGNSIKPGYQYESHFTPLVVPSALENYQTSLRDPAFYMIWKRILKLFVYWQKQMPMYKPEELSIPNVEIEKVEVDKLVTFFEPTFINVTSSLYQTEQEAKGLYEDTVVLVEQQRLNHKPFSVRVNVKSDATKKVLVKFFLVPKYDSKGFEIPLKYNTENFFMLDQFLSELNAGETVISRKSSDFGYTAKDAPTSWNIAEEIMSGKFTPKTKSVSVFPHNLLLPKGTASGMTFQLVVYLQPFDGFKEPNSEGFHPAAFPADRPLLDYQVSVVKNLKFQDVKIFHEE